MENQRNSLYAHIVAFVAVVAVFTLINYIVQPTYDSLEEAHNLHLFNFFAGLTLVLISISAILNLFNKDT